MEAAEQKKRAKEKERERKVEISPFKFEAIQK